MFYSLKILGLVQICLIQGSVVDDKFRENNIVPQIVSETPLNKASISYNETEVNFGTFLKPIDVQFPPLVTWPTEKDAFYTLILNDPDLPEDVFGYSQVNHWLVVNTPENDLTKGETLFEYFGGAPAKGSGTHRYILLVYKQPGKLDEVIYAHLKDNVGGRIKTRTSETIQSISEKLQLKIIVAGNFFTSCYDETVPKFFAGIFEKYDV